MFNCLTPTVVFQEVPNEISLCFSITGCPLACKGCHSHELWKATNGTPLTHQVFAEYLLKYQGLISAVVFFGGEWEQDELIGRLKQAKEADLKTCLYTGLASVNKHIFEQLDYLKTGRWVADKGGLDSPNTNQIFLDTKSNTILNHLFIGN